MKRCAFGVMLAVMMLASASSAQAQQAYGWDIFWGRFWQDAKRMNHYPEPFIYADREATRQPFRIMVAKGGELECTLGSQYFHPETQELTRAGQRRVYWIVTQVPEPYRALYVVRGDNHEITAARMDAVQQSIAHFVPQGSMPQVLATNTEPLGRPGDYVDDTYRKAYSSQPAPVLPAVSDAGVIQ